MTSDVCMVDSDEKVAARVAKAACTKAIRALLAADAEEAAVARAEAVLLAADAEEAAVAGAAAGLLATPGLSALPALSGVIPPMNLEPPAGAAPKAKSPTRSKAAPKAKSPPKPMVSEPTGTATERALRILAALTRRRDAKWFLDAVPLDTPGYFDIVKSPIDYGAIGTKLADGVYEATADASGAFADDVRLMVSNAIAYSPGVDNLCHIAAKANLSAFEALYLKEGLATDGGAAAAAAKEAIKAGAARREAPANLLEDGEPLVKRKRGRDQA